MGTEEGERYLVLLVELRMLNALRFAVSPLAIDFCFMVWDGERYTLINITTRIRP